jgi:hypothetical protein
MNTYSAAFHDPSVEDADASLGCVSGCDLSLFQFFGGAPINTEITCVCYELFPSAGGVPTTHSINVYSFNSADAINIANVTANPPVATGSYVFAGTELDGDIVCVNLNTPAQLAAGDDVFVIEFFDPIGTFAHGTVSTSGGDDTWVYSPGASIFELQLVGDFGLNDMLIEINGCSDAAAPPIPTMGEWGLIVLGLSFLVLGIIGVRNRKTIFARA